MTRSELQQERTTSRDLQRSRIKERAREALCAYGYAVPVEVIAKLAGVSVGGFYLNFEDRDALIAELLRDDISAGADPIEAITKYIPAELAAALVIQ